ncbi:MAG: glycosyltransferase family 1 protein, partial [Chloroflexi bacterium]|nr:glycosyltransferase family 1 protein [Chloroflexota bacterium]
AQMTADVADIGKLAAYADLIVADSPFNAQDLIEQHQCDPDRVRVLPLAVPLEEFSPGPGDPALRARYKLEGRRTILYVGRVASHKRVDLLVEALALVKQQIPNAALLIAGDHNTNPAFTKVVQEIRQRAQTLQIADDVIFTGRVDAIAPFYQLAEVYSSASLHEGFGVPLIEAMASGIPVVVSDATTHPWVLDGAGLLAKPDDATDLAAQLVNVLRNDQLYGELMQRGLARAKEFSLEQYNIHWIEIVAEATAWLPQRPYPFMRLPPLASLKEKTSQELPIGVQAAPNLLTLTLTEDVAQLQAAADVMIKNYTVRSGLPVIGGLLAWLRRNLTSHLREPYLDPMFRRQEGFNWLVVHTFHHLVHQLAQVSQPTNDDRVAKLEAEVAELRAELARQRNDNGVS